ncbi:hypothetical protein [Tenacibaculum jejuense]|uniref:Lipoprotein n=1 Tax=Tenacibaculum jejuense TaxID=584609 RepID=A0A238U542_9FLAO|nr:hypothetical protein [Tenacibaculum jejuense]SNR14212.1 protein of unknown function [Tenacibaculum jejuense]
MKQLIYIILVLLFMSCANKEMNKKYDFTTESHMKTSALEITKYELLSEKFNQYFDLLKLKATHPDFKDNIITQLQDLSQNGILEINQIEEATVQNIEVTNEIKIISDSIEKIKINYDLVTSKSTVKDSIYAYKTSSEIIIDGVTFPSLKIKFSKE